MSLKQGRTASHLEERQRNLVGGEAAPVLGPLPRSRVPVCSASARCRVTEPRVQPARPPRFSQLSLFCFWNPVSHFFFCTNCVHTDWLVLLQREPGGGQEAGGTGRGRGAGRRPGAWPRSRPRSQKRNSEHSSVALPPPGDRSGERGAVWVVQPGLAGLGSGGSPRVMRTLALPLE